MEGLVLQIVDVLEVPMAYLPGNATRVKVRAVGNLQLEKCKGSTAIWRRDTHVCIDEDDTTVQGKTENWHAQPKNIYEREMSIVQFMLQEFHS